MASAVRQFNSKTGGTPTLKQHTDDHESYKKRNVLGFPFKLQKADKTRVIQAALRAVIISDLFFSFGERKGMFQFAKALFEAGKGCAPGTNIDIHDLMPSRLSIRSAVQTIAAKERQQFAKNELKTVLEVGRAVTCDGLKKNINGTKFYDLILHYIISGGEHPNDGFTGLKLISRDLLLSENKMGDTVAKINGLLEDGMKKRYGTSFKTLMDKNFTFVIDCASNMPRVVGMSSSNAKISYNDKWLGCICHKLNTAMKHAYDEDLKNNGIVASNVTLIKNNCEFFLNHPTLIDASPMIISSFNMWKHVSVLHLKWFSRFLKSAHQVQSLVEDGTASAERGYMDDLEKEFRDDETKYPALESIISLFGPLREIQMELEASDYPTMHLVIPMLENARKSIKSFSEGRAFGPMLDLPHPTQIAFAKLTLRHLDIISFHPLWVVGCLLHPRLRALSMVWDAERRSKYLKQGNALLRKMFSDLAGASASGDRS